MDLYIEMYSGISGNMTVAALLELGASREKLEKALSSLDFGQYRLEFGKKTVNGIEAGFFEVHTETDINNTSAAQVDIEEKHEHHHFHHHEHAHHHHTHEQESFHSHSSEHSHRHLKDIEKIIDCGDFSDKVKSDAKKVFGVIADAESKAHGIDRDKVHFHEVGAVDSIVDIVGVCVLLEDLAPEQIYTTCLCEGRGFRSCAHGAMPVPVPAVLNIVKNCSLSIKIIEDEGEHVTPTGAAIAAVFGEGLPHGDFTINRIGLGAGSREFKNTTNILRIMSIEVLNKQSSNQDKVGQHKLDIESSYKKGVEKDSVLIMETNIDDISGEVLGFVMEELLKYSLDVFYTPIYMKKNRPAYMLSVICDKKYEAVISEIIFKHTTTIGIRRYTAEREKLAREIVRFKSSLGEVALKVTENSVYPEYESVKEAALKYELPIKEVYRQLINEYENE